MKISFILLLQTFIISASFSQIDWSNYSTSFSKNGHIAIGVAIPYNGNYDNATGKVVGFAHWNPQYQINIDSTLNDSISLNFVYDTSGIYFLVPQINQNNTSEFEYTILLNNKTIITPWTHVNQFTKTEIGDMKPGSGMMGSYSANWGEYLVAHIRNKEGLIISSRVVYWQRVLPQITSLYTSNNPLEFYKIVKSKDQFSDGPEEIGWHRQYNHIPADQKKILKLPHNENSILINIDSKIYKKEALEYNLILNGKILRKWGANEYNNNHILLKNLDPGDYIIRIRLRRQLDSIKELHFSISPVWYQTAIFKIACFAFAALVLILIFSLYKYRKQQQALRNESKKLETISEALKSIHALLNPHFTFNALGSIQALVNKNDIGSANKYLSSFGALLREILQESKFDLIPLEKDLENIKTYIGLEQLRANFEVNIEVDDCINTNTALMPPFLMQPFIENAIKHGISKMDEKGVIDIQVSRNAQNMLLFIKDNGNGFNVSSYKDGDGLALSKKRIEMLNKGYNEEMIHLKIESSQSGTKILLQFLNWF